MASWAVPPVPPAGGVCPGRTRRGARTLAGRPAVWRQLDFLHLRTQRIRYAVKDYYRAFSQRTKWGLDGLLFVGELSAYEADGKEQYAVRDRLTYMAEVAGKLEEDVACVQYGRRVLDWVETAGFPIRTAMPPKAEYITQATFHLPANEELPAVHGHPKFLDKRAEIATQATA
ncbi:ABC-three component system protein [Hymenobacter monticola]|nr:ABC-three component system protein [Hymenobacter monticola]